ncbi:MAG: hypothetical protein INR69_08960 [Mucilaginibacter polytrichastri]|nr:hypothetical protein [Mucilaginibacter polytrichastri]
MSKRQPKPPAAANLAGEEIRKKVRKPRFPRISDRVKDLLTRDYEITQERADFLLNHLDRNADNLINPDLREINEKVGIIPQSESFSRNAVEELFALPGCIGLRIYTGLNEDYQLVTVLRAIGPNGADILPKKSTKRSAKSEPGTSGNKDDAQRVPPWPPTR